jgi:hypothetical protein
MDRRSQRIAWAIGRQLAQKYRKILFNHESAMKNEYTRPLPAIELRTVRQA